MESAMSKKRFMNVKELSEYLSVRPQTIYKWTCYRKIPYYKIGRLPKFDIEEVERWILKKKVKPIGDRYGIV